MNRVVFALEGTMSATGPQDATTASEVCYRHPDRPTGIRCQRCDRLVCVDCRQQASVGVHCPECTKTAGTQKVYNTRNLPGGQGRVTRGLVAANVIIWIATIAFFGATASSAGPVGFDYGTWGPAIWENSEFWRVISGGFLHSGVIHIGFNMYLLWQLGQQAERVVGEAKFLAIYLVALLGGSAGAILLDPDVPVVGASGAVFGLIGYTVFLYRSRGIGLFDTGLGFLIVLNVLFSFQGGVSLGGHGGGLLTGFLLGALFYGLKQRDQPIVKGDKAQFVVLGVLAIVFFAGAVVASSTWMEPLFPG